MSESRETNSVPVKNVIKMKVMTECKVMYVPSQRTEKLKYITKFP